MIAERMIPDEKDRLIIKLAIKKISYAKMRGQVHLSVDGIKSRIKQMKIYYKVNSLPELIVYLTQNNLV